MTNAEASRIRACLICGAADANLLRTRDGRTVRACDACLRGPARDWLIGGTEREQLPQEARR